MEFDRQNIKEKVARLADAGIFIGTSSWKYAGWCGQLYDPQRYMYRGKIAENRLEKKCLPEYAEVFKTVSVDATYYKFPDEKYLTDLAAEVPGDFQFGFKVTDEITVKKFPTHPRFGIRGGRANENFLKADLFERAFLKPCESIRRNVGVLMFEFSRFYSSDYEHGRDFIADLDRFLGALPKGWPYAIEMRNKAWLQPEYFECLARHQISHVFNAWSAMPTVSAQMEMPGSRTNPSLMVSRFLLKEGRSYEVAKKTFQPYDKTHEMNEEARSAGKALIAEGKKTAAGKTLIFVNNRLEGNALNTIAAMLEPED